MLGAAVVQLESQQAAGRKAGHRVLVHLAGRRGGGCRRGLRRSLQYRDTIMGSEQRDLHRPTDGAAVAAGAGLGAACTVGLS